MCVFCVPFASRMQLRGIPVFLPGPVRHAVLLTPSLSSRPPRPFRSGSPNCHGIISFADNHPVTPLESYRFKIMGARRPSCSSNFQPSTFDFQPPSLSKPFSCNTYGSLRNCCKQKTYGLTNSFRYNTYKKHGGRGPLLNSLPLCAPLRTLRLCVILFPSSHPPSHRSSMPGTRSGGSYSDGMQPCAYFLFLHCLAFWLLVHPQASPKRARLSSRISADRAATSWKSVPA